MQSIKRKIAFIDFCGTMIPFQSADAFVRYSIKNCGRSIVRARFLVVRTLIKLRIFKLLDYITKDNISGNKFRYLMCLKGLPKTHILLLAKEFYETQIKPAFIPEMLNELSKLNQDGYELWFVSGAYDVYLEFAATDLGIDRHNILCSRLLFRDNIFTGKLDGYDCMRENKVILLKKHFNQDLIYSIAYTDSFSDLPLLQYADTGVVIVPRPRWIKEFRCIDYYC